MLVAVEDDERDDGVRTGEEGSNDGEPSNAAQKEVDSEAGEEEGQEKRAGEEGGQDTRTGDEGGQEKRTGDKEEGIHPSQDGGSLQTLETREEDVSDDGDQGEGPPEQVSCYLM